MNTRGYDGGDAAVNLLSTPRPVTQIPARSMIDLAGIGGDAYTCSWGTMVKVVADSDGVLVIANYDGKLVAFAACENTHIPVITYTTRPVSNMLETREVEGETA